MSETERGFAPTPRKLTVISPEAISISPSVFNVAKTDYHKPSLFLGEQPALFDTLHSHYPDIWALYKKLKLQDWDEKEFPFDACNAEFKAASKTDYEIMIRTLAWQWEADSLAANNIAVIMAPFCSSSELWAMYCEIARNEIVHAATYSNIVRSSFDNPQEVLADILEVKESLQRMKAIADVFDQAGVVGRKIMDGLISRDSDEAYDTLLQLLVAVWALERIQFMVSFGVTFGYGAAKRFIPIANAVQKISVDEYYVHAELGAMVIAYELATERGQRGLARNRAKIKQIIDEVCGSEYTFIEFLFEGGREMTGANKEAFQRSVVYHSAPVYKALGFEVQDVPVRNPLPYVEEWLNISDRAIAPQEEKGGSYLLGGVIEDDEDISFELV